MYRLLNVNDGHEYAALVHDAYQADGELGIDFAAVTLPEEKLIRGLILNPTYGLFIEGRLVSAMHWSTYFGHKISKIRCQKIK